MGDDGERMRDETHFAYDVDEPEPASTAVVRAVASVTNRRPTDLPPLYESVDPDALDALFSNATYALGRDEANVTFDYEGFEVVVSSDGRVIVVDDSA